MFNFAEDGNYFIFVCEFEFMIQKVPSSRKSVANLLLQQCLCHLYVVCMCCNTASQPCASHSSCSAHWEGSNSKALQAQSCYKTICNSTYFLNIGSLCWHGFTVAFVARIKPVHKMKPLIRKWGGPKIINSVKMHRKPE